VIAVAMLLLSFVLMFAVNLLQLWLQRRTGMRR
jgi:ABC-type sulfate transport system permease component